MDLDALLKVADETFDGIEPVTQDVLIGKKIVGVRFWPLDNTAWRDLIAQHPPRQGAGMDANAGYNVDAIVPDFPNVALVDGDDVDNMLRRDAKGVEVSRWPDVYRRLSPPDMKNLAIALWGLHEWDPQQRLVAAGKASSGRGKKRSSPASSASPSES